MPSQLFNKMMNDLSIAKKITYSVPLYECKTEIQELKVKSYILLAHSIFEEFLENLALEISKAALDNFVQNGHISRSFVGLISSGLIGRIEESSLSKKIKKEPFENLQLFAGTAYGRFKSVVGDNNGIKTEDQNKLLLPIGFDPASEDPATMAALDGFGSKRGAIAHGFKIAKNHTLSEIQGDINTITAGLMNVDGTCYSYLA